MVSLFFRNLIIILIFTKGKTVEDLESKFQKLIADVKMFKKEKEKEIKQHQSDLESSKNELELVQSEMDLLKKSNDEYREELSTLKSKPDHQSEIARLVNNLNEIQYRFANHKTFVKNIESNLNDLLDLKDSLLNEKVNLQNQFTDAQQQLVAMEEEFHYELKTYGDQIENKNKEVEQLTSTNEKLIKEKDELTEKINVIQADLENKKREYTDLIDKTELNQKEKEHLTCDFEKQIDELNLKIHNLEKDKEMLNEKLAQFGSLESQKVELDTQITEKDNELRCKAEALDKVTVEMTDYMKALDKMKVQYANLESENFKLAEDLKKLYFCNKDLRKQISNLATANYHSLSEKNKLQEKFTDIQQSLVELKQEKEELIRKIQIFDESQDLFQNLTEKLSKLIETKECEYQEIITAKEMTIQELKKQNDHYLEKIQAIQNEKDNLFRNFHELVLNSYSSTTSTQIKPADPLLNNTVMGEEAKKNAVLAVVNDLKPKIEKQINLEKEQINLTNGIDQPATTTIEVVSNKKENKPESILVSTRSTKRKLDESNSKSVKNVHFQEDRDEESVPLARYTKNNRKTKEKTSIDMSFVRKKLDKDLNKRVKNFNNDSDKEISWIDDIYDF